MSSFLLDHDFNPYYQSSDIEFLWHYIKHTIFSSISLYTLVIKKRSHLQPPWFTSSIRHQLHKVHSLRKKCKHNLSPHNAFILSAAESTLHTDISTARVAFESPLVDAFAYSKDSKIYDYIRSFSKSGGIPSVLQYQSQTLTAATGKANAFNDFFHSVFNSSCMDVALTDLPFPATSLSSPWKTLLLFSVLWIHLRLWVEMVSLLLYFNSVQWHLLSLFIIHSPSVCHCHTYL